MAGRDTLEPPVHGRPLIVDPAPDAGLAAAERILQHRFSRQSLLQEAMTHRSAAPKLPGARRGSGSNERLEFVGDRVLGLVMAEWLIERFPHEQEGELGRRLAQLVSQPALVEIADRARLTEMLAVSPGEERAGIKSRATVIADAVEAAIGALYLDGGLVAASNFIRSSWEPLLHGQAEPPKDAKTSLQEWAQARGHDLPSYTIDARSGPSHAPHFTIGVRIAGQHGLVGTAQGNSGTKRDAEQAAAASLLAQLSRPKIRWGKIVTERCGYVALLGAPNAGKSTLLNRMVGAKLSIVTPKAQTTRFRVLGIVQRSASQILLVDTPGIFRPRRKLDRAMVDAAWGGVADADLSLLLLDVEAGANLAVREIAEALAHKRARCWLLLNKIDLVPPADLLPLISALAELAPFEQTYMVSALDGEGVSELLDALADAVPAGPHLFPDDELTDVPDRLLAAEVVREQIFMQTQEEVPYGTSVETESFVERPDGSVRIEATIYVGRPGHKAILIGDKGQRIKQIGAKARVELASLLDRPVHLFLNVKERSGWDEDPERLRAIRLA